MTERSSWVERSDNPTSQICPIEVFYVCKNDNLVAFEKVYAENHKREGTVVTKMIWHAFIYDKEADSHG